MRLSQISVNGLFGRFDHRIPLNLEDRITIITGPNGFGKTMILRILNALFNQSIAKLASIPFEVLELEFDDKSVLTVPNSLGRENGSRKDPRRTKLTIKYKPWRGKVQTYDAKARFFREELKVPVNAIDEIIAELSQVGPELWRHLNTGEVLSLEDVLERYSDQLTRSVDGPRSPFPDWLTRIRRAFPVRLIETDRLYAIDQKARLNTRARQYGHDGDHRRSQPAVDRYSRELGDKIKTALAAYGELSQSLDRTFPARLVSAESPATGATMKILRKRLGEIENKRKLLGEAGLLPDEPETSLPLLGSEDDSKVGVLSIFANDAERKLGVFDELFKKVTLFKRIINTRFLYKRLDVNQTGFQIYAPDGTLLQPSLLSSGEQHELVILYELLFDVEANSLILIDEPELSLHVAWQDSFLDDLGDIAKLSSFDSLIATHSPQIIGKRGKLMVELQGPEAE